jgi:hypothetical protein
VWLNSFCLSISAFLLKDILDAKEQPSKSEREKPKTAWSRAGVSQQDDVKVQMLAGIWWNLDLSRCFAW